MDDNHWNPWTVRNLEEFLFYCCPECDLKNRERSIFLNHILNQHPMAKELICDTIKKEDENSKVENIDLLYPVKSECVIEQNNDDETFENEIIDKNNWKESVEEIIEHIDNIVKTEPPTEYEIGGVSESYKCTRKFSNIKQC